jgi:hypothetical protein
MNERIKELAEQCETKEIGYYFFDREKFAELIVQECAGVCAGIAAVRAGYNDVDGRDTAYSCGDTIKEYFGVE